MLTVQISLASLFNSVNKSLESSYNYILSEFAKEILLMSLLWSSSVLHVTLIENHALNIDCHTFNIYRNNFENVLRPNTAVFRTLNPLFGVKKAGKSKESPYVATRTPCVSYNKIQIY